MLPVGTTNEDSQGGVSRPTRLSPRLKVGVQALKRLALHTFVSRGYAGCRQLLQGAHHTAGGVKSRVGSLSCRPQRLVRRREARSFSALSLLSRSVVFSSS